MTTQSSTRRGTRRKGAAHAPRGKEEVRSALIVAANELFGERGPGSVSVRELAARAGVNHALLHRHFGEKNGLLREVMREHALAFREAATSDPARAAEAMFDVLAQRPSFVRILAQLILSGHSPSEWIVRDGGLAKLASLLAGGDPDDTDRLRAALLSSLGLGWLMFEPFLLAAAGLEGQKRDARRYVKETLTRLSADFENESDGD